MNLLTNAIVQTRKIPEKKKLDWLWLGIIFLFAMNFLGKGPYLLIGLLFIGLIVKNHKKIKFRISIDLVLISLFSFSYFMIFSIYQWAGMGAILKYLIGPTACFIIGCFIVTGNKELIEKTLLTIAFGSFFHGFLNMIHYFHFYGFIPTDTRVPDIWTGIAMASTLQSTYFTLISSLMFYGFVLIGNQKNKLIALIVISAGLFAFFSSIIIGNRTQIFIILIGIAVNYVLYGILAKKDRGKFSKLPLMVLIVAISLLYSMDFGGIKKIVFNSALNSKKQIMQISGDRRIFLQRRVVSQMFDYPFGGTNTGVTYAHNLWLDVLNSTGLIPFFFLMIYTLKSIKNVKSIMNNKNVDTVFKIFIFSIFMGFFLNFMVEPILEGVPYMFLSFCLFNGLVFRFLDTRNSLIVLKGPGGE